MMKWKSIEINYNNVEYETENAILIKMPNSSNYKNYKFWHPRKLIHPGKNNYSLSLVYNDDFIFTLKKYSKLKFNKNVVISEEKIDVIDFENSFEVMNNNIKESKLENEYYLKISEPKKITKIIEIEEELKNE